MKREILTVPFIKGTDQGNEEPQLTDKLLRLENAVVNRRGAVDKRRGKTQISGSYAQDILASHGDRLALVGASIQEMDSGGTFDTVASNVELTKITSEPVMSTEQLIEALGRRVPPSPAAALPVVTFTDGLTFHLNGHTIEVTHFAHAHTDGDAIVRFAEANVIHTGDIVFYGLYPFIDVESGAVRTVVGEGTVRFFADTVVLTVGTFLGGRIHIGLEDTDDLIADLAEGFERLRRI